MLADYGTLVLLGVVGTYASKNALDVFGEDAFEDALFYRYSDALRFELSIDGSMLDMFFQAFSRAERLVEAIFPSADDLHVCVRQYCTSSAFSVRPLLVELQDIGVLPPPDREFRIVQEPGDEESTRAYLAFPIQRKHLRPLLWGAIASDLGISPSIGCKVYLYSLSCGILVHPYDDRGMDVIGRNRKMLGELYKNYNTWLLDYDRKRMDAVYGGT